MSMHCQQKHPGIIASAKKMVDRATMSESAGATTSSMDDLPVNETHEFASSAEKSATMQDAAKQQKRVMKVSNQTLQWPLLRQRF